MLHIPVLLEESVDFLIQDKNGFYIDCTYGRGGHTKAILDKISSFGSLSAFDKDPQAIESAAEINSKNFKIIHDSFCNISKYYEKNTIDGIIYDLGTCSTHLDDPLRGFSFNKDGPLDMRFDNTKGQKLYEWINNAQVDEIIKILYEYGDEKHAKLISKAIKKEREKQPILKTTQLAEIIQNIYPEKRKKIHPATKTFQALRIFINDEIGEIKKSLQSAERLLKKNGIIVTIAFHSIEDNLIKNFFKASEKSFPKDIPLNNEKIIRFKILAKKIRPQKKEIANNPRSRSAIMRVFQKI